MKAVLLTIFTFFTISTFAQRQYGVEDTTYKRRANYGLPKDAIKVFPNPVVTDLYITIKMDSLFVKAVYLYDKDGNRIIEQRINSTLATPIKLSMGNYPQGIYYLVLETNKQPFQMQVVKN